MCGSELNVEKRSEESKKKGFRVEGKGDNKRVTGRERKGRR